MEFARRVFSAFLAAITAAVMYPLSFWGVFCDDEFSFENSAYSLTKSGENAFEIAGKSKIFNYFGIKYSCSGYVKGSFSYRLAGGKEAEEEFFLEPGSGKEFFSFIDGCLERKKGISPLSLSFTPLSGDCGDFEAIAFSAFNRKIPGKEVFIKNEKLKAGVNLEWGGALSYLEDLDSGVEAFVKDGKSVIATGEGERSGAKGINRNVNLINSHDTGRLVQQSYYGATDIDGYENGFYNGTRWPYNPVQGGNQFNGKSKIVDLRESEDEIYIKARPMDWALNDESITPSYMEAVYSLSGGALKAQCRFVDFSGYNSAVNSQELPAFYCAEPMNTYVYPDEGGNIVYRPDLIFWPDAGYPNFKTSENWSAFTCGENGFGIGLYTPHNSTFLAGVFEKGKSATNDPAREIPTSYIACVSQFEFKSFSPFEYEFYIATGTAGEIRNTFLSLQ